MGGWPVGHLHNAVEELNSGVPRTNPDSSRVEDLIQGPPDIKSSALNHSATPPPCLCFGKLEKISLRTLLHFHLSSFSENWTPLKPCQLTPSAEEEGDTSRYNPLRFDPWQALYHQAPLCFRGQPPELSESFVEYSWLLWKNKKTAQY